MASSASKITYIWEGTDNKGNRSKGEINARSDALVKAELRRQGIRPLKVKKKPQALFGSMGQKPIVPKDIAVFSRQLATMMASGIPLVQSFDIIGKGHEKPAMQDMLANIKSDIEGGSTLAESLGKYPFQFDELFCNLVEAGEHAGILEDLLVKIAEYKEKTESLKAKIKKALTYPISVLVVAVVVTAILLIFVVPQFESLFSGFGADLPAFTQMVVELSRFMQEWWWAVFGIIGGVVFVLMQVKKRSRKFNHLLDRMILKMPIIGDIMNKAAIARYARTLSTMSAAGVPLVEALESVSGATGNIVYSEAVLQMREQVATGIQLQQAMKNVGLFPHMVVQMVAIGEEAGSVESMLGKVADFYEEEVDNAVDSLSSLIEPLIMAILGILVGGLIVAMYLPIFMLGSVF
ncbi:MAG: type IV pilus assembly protein PilC [Cycloclasticus pugetii]|jgi:type IV pilus assembly protein PilC|uniref:Type II secretory pathway, component PulF/PilC n=2 Tax=Cycloclasticus TaxID=34067 RepID=S5TZX8_9GAMM|nr:MULTISPECIES: type II secretion system F family protein [Cycloclasticus]AFT66422.1 Type II secretion system protein [Cycloclasticus sp. P1]AGS40578.1 Type II secretory pathway, component PulF/PilC [Cycloclasticus zancles 78-ME]ATI04002.1 type II secretion system F family protein [Cycloclasticus sp. PY97N]EPD12220.1 Type II secretion system protein [Cycloclasticus pugetii]